jgi:hypothetical protein
VFLQNNLSRFSFVLRVPFIDAHLEVWEVKYAPWKASLTIFFRKGPEKKICFDSIRGHSFGYNALEGRILGILHLEKASGLGI